METLNELAPAIIAFGVIGVIALIGIGVIFLLGAGTFLAFKKRPIVASVNLGSIVLIPYCLYNFYFALALLILIVWACFNWLVDA